MLNQMRCGIGYDLHKFTENKRLFLGGVEILFSKGLLAHSDGDALCHAICDAILGALGLGDIGTYFPDTDPVFKDITGPELIARVLEIAGGGRSINIINIDVVIICDKPNLSEYKQAIRSSVAKMLGIEQQRVNIKAKTTESTSSDTLSSYCVVLMETGKK